MSWTGFNTGLTSTIVTKLAVVGTNVFAGTNTGVFMSNTSTAGWTAVNNGLSSVAIRCLYASGNNLFVGTDNGIFLSQNNGTSWTSVSTGLTTNAKIFSIMSDGTDLFIGADTTVWRRPLSQMSAAGLNELNAATAKVEIYPNPFHSFGTVQFNNILSETELEIFNIFGQKVKSINQVSGDKIKIDRDNLSAGIYFFELKQEGKSIVTGKFMIRD